MESSVPMHISQDWTLILFYLDVILLDLINLTLKQVNSWDPLPCEQRSGQTHMPSLLSQTVLSLLLLSCKSEKPNNTQVI